MFPGHFHVSYLTYKHGFKPGYRPVDAFELRDSCDQGSKCGHQFCEEAVRKSRSYFAYRHKRISIIQAEKKSSERRTASPPSWCIPGNHTVTGFLCPDLQPHPA